MGNIAPGTFAHVIQKFLRWMDKQNYAPATRVKWERELLLAQEEGGLGGCSVQVIRPSIIQAFLDGLAHYPGKQEVAKTALKALEKFAIVRDLVPQPFMIGVSTVGGGGGHAPWPDSHVALAEQHLRDDLSRAVTLAVNTGQRGSDTVRMSETDIEEKLCPTTGIWRRGINVTQQKTGRRLWVPFISPEFEATLASWPRRPGPFILKPKGTRYSREELSARFTKHRDTIPALAPLKEAGLVLHGLRATAVVRGRKLGLTDLQISNIYGMSEGMVARYSRLADQGEMAMAVVHYLSKTNGEQVTSNIPSVTVLKR